MFVYMFQHYKVGDLWHSLDEGCVDTYIVWMYKDKPGYEVVIEIFAYTH